MTRRLHFYSFAFLMLFISGCYSDCIQIELDKNEKVWTKNLVKGDECTFQSDVDQKVLEFTLLESIDTLSPCNRFEVSEFQYGFSTRKYFEGGNKTKIAPIKIEVYEDEDTKDSELANKYLKVYDMKVSLLDTSSTQRKTVHLINGTECRAFYFENKIKNKELASFCWNVKKGLLQFTMQSGETFTRVF